MEAQREEILRQQEALRKRLVQLPAEITRQRELRQEQTRRRAKAGGLTVPSGRPQTRGIIRKRQPRWILKAKTIALLLVLLLIIFLAMRSLPQG